MYADAKYLQLTLIVNNQCVLLKIKAGGKLGFQSFSLHILWEKSHKNFQR